LVFITRHAFDFDTDLVENDALDDYFWVPILCPGQGGLRGFLAGGKVGESVKESGRIV